MRKSRYVLALDEVQKPVTKLLRSHGFRKRGRSYAKSSGDGPVQIVRMQICETLYPKAREVRHDKFGVVLYVCLPCTEVIERGVPPEKAISTVGGELVQPLDQLAFQRGEIAWSLEKPTEAMGEFVADLIGHFALPFLERFADYRAVLAEYRAHGRLPLVNEGRSALVLAMVCHHLGDADEARSLFDRAARSAIDTGHRGFGEHVATIRKRCGF